ncbi:MAG: hypothetical protein HUU34_02710 [Saprospiraceae bacterium]|jgi:hypothetical protein|nr:hypothetical protein [Saprospiraceae bacterium]
MIEEHTPKDNLDDFIRRSFERYEEDPSPAFWDNLNDKLPNQPATGMALIHRFGWQIAAATVILILSSTLIAGYLHFTNKVNTLIAGQVELKEQLLNNKPIVSDQPSTPSLPRSNSRSPVQFHQNNPSYVIVDQREGIPPTLLIENQVNAISANSVNVEVSPDIKPQVEDAVAPLAYLPKWNILSSQFQPGTIVAKVMSPIQPVSKQGWYSGVHSTVSIMSEKLKKPGPDDNDNHHGPRRVVSSQSKLNHIVADYWVKAGKQIAPHLAFETGVGYQQFDRIAEHQPELKIRDGERVHGHGGPGGPSHGGHDEYDFNYTLNSYAGSMDINLRMSQVDTTAMYPDDQPLDLNLTTKEHVKTLRIPLLLATHTGKGRLKFAIKGGLIANVFLQNELEVTGISSGGNRFKRSDPDEPVAQKESTQRYGLDFVLAAGAEYRLNNKLSVLAEPTFSASLALQNNNLAPAPSYQTAGINIGLNYRF